MNGRGTLDDQIFQLINYKQLITTDVTDGFKTSLNIDRTDPNEIAVDQLKDGTIAELDHNGNAKPN